jgi:Flp pilus assembly protein TadD
VAEQLDVDSLNDLAVLLAQSGRSEEARSLLETCLVVAPDHADARQNLADIDGLEVAA